MLLIHKVKWRHSNLWSQYDLCVGGKMAHCVKLSGDDLSSYSKKIGSFKKMSVLSLSYKENDVTIANILQSLPHVMAEKQLA